MCGQALAKRVSDAFSRIPSASVLSVLFNPAGSNADYRKRSSIDEANAKLADELAERDPPPVHRLSRRGMEPYLGEITLYAYSFAIQGYALCQGQTLSISSNTALFSLLGTR